MNRRREIRKLIEEKQHEISELELKIVEARSYIQGLEQSLKLYTKARPEKPIVRPNSMVGQIRALILKMGRPMHIDEILLALGRPTEKKERERVGATLFSYLRNGKVFVRTGPNIFGLVEWKGENNPIRSIK